MQFNASNSAGGRTQLDPHSQQRHRRQSIKSYLLPETGSTNNEKVLVVGEAGHERAMKKSRFSQEQIALR
jgi:hypothetical protein